MKGGAELILNESASVFSPKLMEMQLCGKWEKELDSTHTQLL